MVKLSDLQKVRAIIAFFMVALVVSGATAFPVESELNLLCSILNINAETAKESPAIFGFVYSMKESISEMNQNSPQLAYGYDWLAFAHLVIALMFIGPFRDPVRNKWVIQWGMIACVAILPLAFICGPIRQIPIYWTLIDCSFGVFGIIPLIFCMKLINRLEKEQQRTE
ncbi:MAG: hypothetical protein K6F48_06160 [Paludibacteraceae bacterium]|nr:hypothetical protein [Paludibacteraceae bacterium]